MKKFLALLFGASVVSAAAFGGCGKRLDQSLLAGEPQPGEEDCTHLGCYWLLSPTHPAWEALDNGVNPPAGQDTMFYHSGLTYREVLLRPPANEAYYLCAYHFIAAQLNKLNGADSGDIDDSYNTAEQLFRTFSPADVANDAALDQRLRSLAEDLMAYNTGELGPGTCTCPTEPPVPRAQTNSDRAPVSEPEPGTSAGSGTPPPPPIDAPPPPPPPIDAPPPPPPTIDAPPPPPIDAPPPPPPPIDAGVPPIDAPAPPPIDAPPPPPIDASVPDLDAPPAPDPCVCRDRPDHV
ncbi:MAG TPA: hypothetical protein VHE35_02705 [Kofleriaceae bacterium]|nr:hypothetical protein [Kofleriaceae bacterium]